MLFTGFDSETAGGVILAAILGVLAGRIGTLSARQKQLQAELHALRARLEAQPLPAAEPVAAQPDLASTPAEPEPAPEAAATTLAASPAPEPLPEILALPPAAREPGPLNQALAAARQWLIGGNTVARVGILLLFLGLAFLLRYAAEHLSVPIELRYAGVGAAGLVLLGLGWRLRARRRAYGLMLQGGAFAVMYLDIFAAMHLDPLIPTGMGFSLLVATVLFSTILAVAQDALGLAVAGAAGGFAAPILASSGGEHHIALFAYLALLNAGILAIAWFKAWRPLNLVGFAGTFVLGFAWGLQSYEPAMLASTEPFLVLFFLMYVAVALLFARRVLLDTPDEPDAATRLELMRWTARRSNALDGVLLFGTPVVGFAAQDALVRHLHLGDSFSALALGLFYLLLGTLLLRQAGRRQHGLVEIYLALGVIFATLAVPLGLDARWTSAAWAIEGAGLYWLSLRQQRRLARGFAVLVELGAALAYLGTMKAGTADRLISAASLGALMLGAALLFGWWLLRRVPPGARFPEDAAVRRLFLFAGTTFLALLAPLLCRAEGSAALWAVGGLAALFLGSRLQDRGLMLAGLLLQLGAGLLLGLASDGDLSFWYSGFWAPAILALAAYAGAWRLHRQDDAAWPGTPMPVGFDRLSAMLLAWATVWWSLAWLGEIDRFLPGPVQPHAALLVAAATVAVWIPAARRWQWPMLARFTGLLQPAAILALLDAYGPFYHPAADWGALAWPVWFAVHLLALRGVTGLLPRRVAEGMHVVGCWIALAVLALEARFLFILLTGEVNAWRWLGWATVPTLYLLAMAQRRVWAIWPISTDLRAYRSIAAPPVALIMLAWFWLSNALSDGTADPLPYLPLLNPLELGQILVLFGIALWLRVGFPALPFAQRVPAAAPAWLLGASGLFLATCAVLRTAHHWGGIPWDLDLLLDSMAVQASLSILWAITALGMMVMGHRSARRSLWLTGAGLIALVVIKLFLVELLNTGGLPRIVSFVGVGVLLLIVGYFAPLPPRHAGAAP
ncbi:MAG TPA: DUF2339 domain-containing protein [Aliidongia sp.]|nr:DUF2339 domain-containing protein [Aliidongia sp.]